MIDIDKLTIEEARELARSLGRLICAEPQTGGPFQIGKSYFFRTVTHHDVGRVVAVYPTEIVIEEASWIADDGRFHEALRDGKLNEVEPFPSGRVIIGRGSICDVAEWTHPLPRTVK
jgi:hypothetical protein